MLIELFLSIVPGLEARFSALLLLCQGHAWLIPLSVILNFAAVLLFVKLLDYSLLPKRVERFLEKRLEKRAEMIENWFEKYGSFFLFILIALPSTGVGSFTAAFIGSVFELRGWLFYISLFLGIIVSILPVLALIHGINFAGLGCQ
jgi:uncharacterized membrane protein